MSTGNRPQPGPQRNRRDLVVIGLQRAAALLMAQQTAGKAARDGLFLLHYGPQAPAWHDCGRRGFRGVVEPAQRPAYAPAGASISVWMHAQTPSLVPPEKVPTIVL